MPRCPLRTGLGLDQVPRLPPAGRFLPRPAASPLTDLLQCSTRNSGLCGRDNSTLIKVLVVKSPRRSGNCDVLSSGKRLRVDWNLPFELPLLLVRLRRRRGRHRVLPVADSTQGKVLQLQRMLISAALAIGALATLTAGPALAEPATRPQSIQSHPISVTDPAAEPAAKPASKQTPSESCSVIENRKRGMPASGRSWQTGGDVPRKIRTSGGREAAAVVYERPRPDPRKARGGVLDLRPELSDLPHGQWPSTGDGLGGYERHQLQLQ